MKRLIMNRIMSAVCLLGLLGGPVQAQQNPDTIPDSAVEFPNVMVMGVGKERITSYLLRQFERTGFDLTNSQNQESYLVFEDRMQTIPCGASLNQGLFCSPSNPNSTAMDRITFNMMPNEIGTLITLRRFRIYSPNTPFERIVELTLEPEWMGDSIKGLNTIQKDLQKNANPEIPD